MNRRPPLFGKAARPPAVDAHEPLLASIRAGKIEFHGLGRRHYPGDRLAAGELPGLLSLGYWDARGEQDWGMALHRNEGLEVCLLETGALRFTVEGRSYPLESGDLTITRPWQAHRQGDPRIAAGRLHWATISVGAQRPDQGWRWPGWLLLAPQDRAELTRRLRQTSAPVWRASSEIRQCFQRLGAAVAAERGDRRLSRVTVGLNELMLGLLDLLRSENRAEQPRLASPEHSVELFLGDLRRNPASLAQEWTLAGMAAACGMGTTRFSLFCRRLTNESPLRFLNRARLESAARLLRAEPDRSVTDIAFACGFASSQYFANQFRRRFRSTPSDFRAG